MEFNREVLNIMRKSGYKFIEEFDHVVFKTKNGYISKYFKMGENVHSFDPSGVTHSLYFNDMLDQSLDYIEYTGFIYSLKECL